MPDTPRPSLSERLASMQPEPVLAAIAPPPEPARCEICGDPSLSAVSTLITTPSGERQRVVACTNCIEAALNSVPRRNASDAIGALFGPRYAECSFDNMVTGETPEEEAFVRSYNEIVEGREGLITRLDVRNLRDRVADVRAFTERAVRLRDGRAYLASTPGGGKTHLMAAAARTCIEGGLSVEVISAFDFVEEMTDPTARAAAFEKKSRSQIIERLASAEALFVEDLNANTFSDRTRRYFDWLFKEVVSTPGILYISSSFPLEEMAEDVTKVGVKNEQGLGDGAVDRLREPPFFKAYWDMTSWRLVQARLDHAGLPVLPTV